MFGLQEENAEKNKQRLKELVLRSQEQEARFETLYEEHDISSTELLHFLANSENFDPETWETLQRLRKEAQQEIEAKLQIKDLSKTKKAYSDLHAAQQWILVR
jgi:cytidylate kinase